MLIVDAQLLKLVVLIVIYHIATGFRIFYLFISSFVTSKCVFRYMYLLIDLFNFIRSLIYFYTLQLNITCSKLYLHNTLILL